MASDESRLTSESTDVLLAWFALRVLGLSLSSNTMSNTCCYGRRICHPLVLVWSYYSCKGVNQKSEIFHCVRAESLVKLSDDAPGVCDSAWRTVTSYLSAPLVSHQSGTMSLVRGP